MRRRLNVKLLASLIGGFFVFAVSVYGLHAYQVDRNAEGLIRRANEFRDAGNLKESIRLLARYMNHRPDDIDMAKRVALDSKTNLISMMEARKEPTRRDYNQTMYLVDEAVRKKGSDPELRREAADFWFKLRGYKAAIDNLGALEKLSKKSPPEGEEQAVWTIEDELLYVNCLRLNGTPAEDQMAIDRLNVILGFDTSTEQFDAASAKHPELIEAYMSLTDLWLRKRLDAEMAEKTLNQMVSANHKNYKAYLNRANYIRFVRRDESGVKIYKRDIETAYQLDDSTIETMVAMAKMHLQDKSPQQAKSLVEAGLDKAETLSEKAVLYNLLAEIYIAESDTEGAFKILDEGINAIPKARELLWKKARLVLDDAGKLKANAQKLAVENDPGAEKAEQDATKRFAEVEAMYRPLEQAYTPVSRIEYLRARVMMQRDQNMRGATRRLAKIRELVDPMLQFDIDVYLSMGYLANAEYDLRLETIKRMIKARPGNLSAQESLIQTLVAMGRTKDAAQAFQQVAQSLKAAGEELTPSLKLIGFQIETTRLNNSTTELTPEQLAGLRAKVGAIYKDETIEKARRQSVAISFFNKIKDKKTVTRLIQTMLDEDPANFSFWALKLQYAESMPEANQILADMRRNIDPKFEIATRPMEAKMAVRFAPETAGAVLAKLEQDTSRYTDQQKSALFFELGTLQLAFLKNREDGLRLLEQASKLTPRRLDILQVLYQDATVQADPDRMTEMVNRIRSVTTENDDAYRMVEAGRIIWMLNNGQVAEGDRTKSLNRARQLVERAKLNRPDFIPMMVLDSRLQRAEGDVQAAVATLQQAHAIKTGDGNIIRQIAQLYRDMKNEKMAEMWIKKLPHTSRSSGDKRNELIGLSKRSSTWTAADAAKAVSLVEEVVAPSSTSNKDWLLRSQIYLMARQIGPAEQAARKCLDLDKTYSDSWANLINILVAQKKTSEAQAIIQQIPTAVPEKDRWSVLGRCFTILRNYGQAEASLVKALEVDPKNALVKRMYAEVLMTQAKNQEAANMIDKMIKEGDPVNNKREIQWGRRALARMLADTGSFTSFNQALGLIDENAEDGKLGDRDLALYSAICYKRPEPVSWDRALIRIEQVAKKRPLNSDELFMKAQLYEKYGDDGRWKTAKSLALSVLGQNPGNTRVIENYVKWLLKRGELVEAEQLASNNLRGDVVTRLRVEVHSLAKSGNSNGAMQKLQKNTPQDPKNAKDLSELLTMSAIAEELGQYDKRFYKVAERNLDVLSKLAPREILRLATVKGLYGDTNGIQQGLTICMKTDTVNKPAMRAGVVLSILRAHQEKWSGPLKSTVNVVGNWLDELGTSSPNDLAVQWRVAEFHDMMGNLDKVEGLYQSILDSPEFTDPIERGMLMNNLSYSMALNGKGGESFKLIQQAKKEYIGPTADVLDTEGFVLFVRGDNKRAIALFREAIKSGPATAQKYFHLALALSKDGEKDAAREAWGKAVEAGLEKVKLPPALHDEYDDMARKFQ